MTEVMFCQIEMEPSNDEFIDAEGYSGLMKALAEVALQQSKIHGCPVMPFIRVDHYEDF